LCRRVPNVHYCCISTLDITVTHSFLTSLCEAFSALTGAEQIIIQMQEIPTSFVQMLSTAFLPALRSLRFADVEVESRSFASVILPEHLTALVSIPNLRSIQVGSSFPHDTSISPLVSGISWSRPSANEAFVLDILRVIARPRVVLSPEMLNDTHRDVHEALVHRARHLMCHYSFVESTTWSTIAVTTTLGLRTGPDPSSPPPTARTLTLHTMSPRFDLVANGQLGLEVPIPATVEELIIVTFIPGSRGEWEPWDARLSRALELHSQTSLALKTLCLRFESWNSIRTRSFFEEEAAAVESNAPGSPTPHEMPASYYRALLPKCEQLCAARGVEFAVETLFKTKSWH